MLACLLPFRGVEVVTVGLDFGGERRVDSTELLELALLAADLESGGTAARAITWGTSFEASTTALPTTTVSTARLDVGFIWNAATSKWRCLAVA